MIRQPEKETRNVNDTFYKAECRRIKKLNEIFGNINLTDTEERALIWLAGLDDWTMDNLVSAFKKVINENTKCSVHKKLENNQHEVKSRADDRDMKQHDHRQEER